MDAEQRIFSQSLLSLPKIKIADVVRLVDKFQGEVKRSKLDKGYNSFLNNSFLITNVSMLAS